MVWPLWVQLLPLPLSPCVLCSGHTGLLAVSQTRQTLFDNSYLHVLLPPPGISLTQLCTALMSSFCFLFKGDPLRNPLSWATLWKKHSLAFTIKVLSMLCFFFHTYHNWYIICIFVLFISVYCWLPHWMRVPEYIDYASLFNSAH